VPKFLLQQIGQQTLIASGLQSAPEMVEILRHAHNIRDLPPPSGIVVGSAANPGDRKDLTAAAAQALVQGDREAVTRNLLQEASRIQSALLPAGAALKRDSLTPASDSQGALASSSSAGAPEGGGTLMPPKTS
jgi:hypothetical protein